MGAHAEPLVETKHALPRHESTTLAGVPPSRVGTTVGAYKAGEALPAQKRVKKRKGPDGTSLDRVSPLSRTQMGP